MSLASQWEAVAAKPGNVHRLADFSDMGLIDFLASASAITAVAHHWLPKWTPRSAKLSTTVPSFAEFIFDAIQATRRVTSANTNLGICLLLGPLAEAYAKLSTSQTPPDSLERSTNSKPLSPTLDQTNLPLESWRSAVQSLIAAAPVEQTRWLYRAIAAAQPGGMGQVPEADVAAVDSLTATDTVAHVMNLAADRDLIAAEYTTGFHVTFSETVPTLGEFVSRGYGVQWAIIGTYIRLLARRPDTLIARKAGLEKAREVSTWAGRLADGYFALPVPDWDQFQDRQEACEADLADLDFALRSNGNGLNPGTTADLIAAGLFVSLLSGAIVLPARW